MRVLKHEASSYRPGMMLLGLLLALAFLLSGCTGGPGGPIPYEPANFGTPDVQAQPVANAQEPIGPLDILQITVFQVESLSGDFQVDTSGAISYPLIGAVEAQGRTPVQLAQQISSQLSQKYLQSPNVQVAIKQRAEQTITVDGSVNQPGVFPVKGPTTLLQAVAMARGTSQDANPSRVYIFRTIKGERLAGAFDLQSIRRAQAQDPTVYGNDIVVVDGSRGRQLFRDLISTMPLMGVLRPFY
jgi:polysaccharide export outer membrane protein